MFINLLLNAINAMPNGGTVDVFADRADFALQETPLGTADAVKAALKAAPEDVAEVLILSGDVPLVDEARALLNVKDRRNGDGA